MSSRVETMATTVFWILFVVGSVVCYPELEISYEEKDFGEPLEVNVPVSEPLNWRLKSDLELTLNVKAVGILYPYTANFTTVKGVWNHLRITQDKVVLSASGKEQSMKIPREKRRETRYNRKYRITIPNRVHLHLCNDACEQNVTGAAIVILPMVSCLMIIGLVAVNVYYNPQMKTSVLRLFKEGPFSHPVPESWAPPPPPRINNHHGNQVNIITISSNNNIATPSEHYYEIVEHYPRTDVSVNALHNHRRSHSDTASDDNGYIQPIPVRDSLRSVPRPQLPITIRPQR
ncbi:uncharacterized protein LOC135212687 [Macrobrachium nipponense]|uniref:uncharacterized protein LOC135212687 n=1 Tax=Macrobrachium nipponense TaxID=159736 RepID=UPI0030C7E40C